MNHFIKSLISKNISFFFCSNSSYFLLTDFGLKPYFLLVHIIRYKNNIVRKMIMTLINIISNPLSYSKIEIGIKAKDNKPQAKKKAFK